MSIAKHANLRCPLCNDSIDPLIHKLQGDLQPHLVRILRVDNPDWSPDNGVCPECVFNAARKATKERSVHSLQHELLIPYPVYLRDHFGILPTAQRVHAHPNTSGRGVTIAFLDSGFYPHPDLTEPDNRVLVYADATTTKFSEKKSFRRPHYSSWHGLMTSSIAAGTGFMSGYEYPGIATRANLVLVKTGTPHRRRIRITERDIQRALNWVIVNQQRFNIRVVNISVGGDRPSTGELTLLDKKVENAIEHGMVVVVAAGNSGRKRIVPPASAPSAITVGGLDDQNSLDRRLHRIYTSNYGQGANGVSKPDLIAPATWLAAPILPNTKEHNEAQFLWRLLESSDRQLRRTLETDYVKTRLPKATLELPTEEIRQVIRQRMIEQKYIHPHYQHVDGTSMAAPIVSSIVAQMLEADPALTPAQVKNILLDTAEPLPGVPAERQGRGVVHGGRAVATVLRASMKESAHTNGQNPRSAITFHYYDTNAHEVALVGSFNRWQARGYEMHQNRRGAWELDLTRPTSGQYAYKFLIDGQRWINDPENSTRIEDGYGGFNSLLSIA